MHIVSFMANLFTNCFVYSYYAYVNYYFKIFCRIFYTKKADGIIILCLYVINKLETIYKLFIIYSISFLLILKFLKIKT